MNAYELYINGILCDLSSVDDITLVYQSGIFSELDIIQSNGSYSIDLPLTPRNMRIVELAQRPDVDADTPYIKLSAALYKGGVPIFDAGNAAITEISDVISIVLTWGNVENFEPLFDEDMKDLAPTLYNMGIGSITWNNNSQFVEVPSNPVVKDPQMGFFAVDFGRGLSNMKYIHPSIRTSIVLEAIEKRHGITIDGKDRLWPNSLLPCVSKNGDDNSNTAEAITAIPYISPRPSTTGYVCLKSYSAINTSLYDPRNVIRVDSGDFEYVDTSKVDKIRITFEGSDYSPSFDIPRYHNTTPSPSYITLNIWAKGSILYGKRSDKMQNEAYHFDSFDIEIDTSDIDKLSIRFDPDDGYEYPANSNYQPTWKVRIIMGWRDVMYPSVFPIGVNLPDMSQGDFLSALLTMSGLFAYVDKDAPDTIKLMSADDLTKNAAAGDFVDWSHKVLLNDRRMVDMPDASTFSIDDYAQRNILDYENDDEVNILTAGEIAIQNVNIEKEAEFSVPFSATGANDDGIALIPAYKKTEGSTQVTYSEPSPRILDITFGQENESSPLIYYGQFPKHMYFGGEKGIVSAKYAGLQHILRRARMITVRAKLSPVDLYTLRYDMPVYIAQFGQFFAIYKIETGSDDICECQLIKLDISELLPTYYVTLRYMLAASLSEEVLFEATNGTTKYSATMTCTFDESGYAKVDQQEIMAEFGLNGNLYPKLEGYDFTAAVARTLYQGEIVDGDITMEQI